MDFRKTIFPKLEQKTYVLRNILIENQTHACEICKIKQTLLTVKMMRFLLFLCF